MTDALAAMAAITLRFVAATNSPESFTVEAEPVPVGSSIFLHRVAAKHGPAMFGRTERVGELLKFAPSFSLKSGKTYQASLRLPSGVSLTRQFLVPKDRTPKTEPRVQAVYPSGKELPANLLKFYVCFSEPMRGGRAIFDQLRIERRDGSRVDSPWRRVELWNEDSTRLTLWIHPGRIKQGVNLRSSMGPVLQPGHEHDLVMDAGLTAISGRSLGTEFRHRFRAVAEDRQVPDPGNWKLNLSSGSEGQRLTVTADEPLDHALWKRHQWIESDAGVRIDGKVVIGDSERRWSFNPSKGWQPGDYWLCVDPWVEDLGGNGPGRPFERLVDAPESNLGVTRRAFTVR